MFCELGLGSGAQLPGGKKTFRIQEPLKINTMHLLVLYRLFTYFGGQLKATAWQLPVPTNLFTPNKVSVYAEIFVADAQQVI